MSIFFDFEVGPTGRRFRRAVDHDKQDIEEFWKQKDTEQLFNVDDIGSLIELSTLSICMIDKDKTVTGFMSLSDHPNLPGIDPATWELWIRNMFQRYYVSHNTLFVNFACCKDTVANFFTEEAFVSVFSHNSYWLQIVLVVPPNCPSESLAIFNVFKQRSVFKYCSYDKGDDKEFCYCLYVALRKDFCPALKTRRGVEEDNDDLLAILDKENKKLKEALGEYYISEIIGRHPEMRRQILVAETQDKVVGGMGLNPNIDFKGLAALYELAPYHGLRVVTPLEKEQLLRSNEFMELIGEPIMYGNFDPFTSIVKPIPAGVPNLDDISEADCDGKYFRESARRRSSFRKSVRLSKVGFESQQGSQTSEASSDHMVSVQNSVVSTFSAIDYLDEDAFDYEIINIDTQLLSSLGSKMEIVHNPQRLTDDHIATEVREEFKDKQRKSSTLQRGSGKIYKKRSSRMSERKQSDTRGLLEHRASKPDAKHVIPGNPNAFMIELFGLQENIDPRRGYDLLAAAFECMKVYEYCLMRVPCSIMNFPLLQHFTLVPTKDNVCSDYSLYIAHRNSVLGKLRVREAELADILEISSLFVNLDVKQTIYTVESTITKRNRNLAFVLLSGLAVVGIAIIEPPTQTYEIRMMFTADMHHNHKYHAEAQGVSSGFSAIEMIIVYPVFEPHYRFFLRELMRLSGSTVLLWMTTYRSKLVASKANSVIPAMVPILPRKSGYYTGVSEDMKNMIGSSKSSITFSTWMITKKLTSVPKVNVDTRIVVVGSSRTAMAFINSLVFGVCSTYLTFTNITLVSPNGLPYVRQFTKEAELMFLRNRTLSDQYLKCTPYCYYVNVVYGTMCEINRQMKHIVLENGQKYKYDKLFLLVGKQYQHPGYLKALQDKENDLKNGVKPPYVRLDVPRAIECEPQVADYDTPENVFIINTPTDATKALLYCKGLYWWCDEVKVLIYGASIETYCCLTALLEVLSAEEIIFIEAFPPEDPKKPRVPVFSNIKVDETIRTIIKDLNIQCYRGYHFESWKTNQNNVITEASFVSYTRMITLECSALFYYGKRGINTHAFFAVNKCGVSYDGGILIDHEFRTNDPAIYSAGPATRYNRRYLGDFQQHKFYDSCEVGQKLGKQIIDELDPLFPKESPKSLKKCNPRSVFESRKSSEGSQKIPPHFQLPVLKKPVKWHCILPGGLQYLEIRTPGPKYYHQFVQSMNYSGYILETFKSGYFRLHLSNDFAVNGITCLTLAKYSLETYSILHGLPSVMLNNVHLRFFTKQISDLFDFFGSPWAVFLYHEQAAELLAVTKEIVPKENPKSLAEALRDIADTLQTMDTTSDFKEKLRSNFERHYHVRAAADHVIQWLTDNDLLLPIYMRPWQTVEFEHDKRTNPIFQKRKRTLKKMLAFIRPSPQMYKVHG